MLSGRNGRNDRWLGTLGEGIGDPLQRACAQNVLGIGTKTVVQEMWRTGLHRLTLLEKNNAKCYNRTT